MVYRSYCGTVYTRCCTARLYLTFTYPADNLYPLCRGDLPLDDNLPNGSCGCRCTFLPDSSDASDVAASVAGEVGASPCVARLFDAALPVFLSVFRPDCCLACVVFVVLAAPDPAQATPTWVARRMNRTPRTTPVMLLMRLLLLGLLLGLLLWPLLVKMLWAILYTCFCTDEPDAGTLLSKILTDLRRRSQWWSA